ncbi:hypothetical protein Mal65_41850 [Crateriforma conspicua]|nr:hypothetical protein Mal65_41850 [Crateriforma conspicua]
MVFSMRFQRRWMMVFVSGMLPWLVLLCADTTDADSPVATGDWIGLFDCHSLDGWEGDPQYFRVQDGCIVAGTLKKKIPHNYFLCTRETYGDFELSFEAKLVGEGKNAGVQFRSQRIPDETEVRGYQADIGIAWKRPVWGALYDESRRRKMLAEPDAQLAKSLVRPGQWNEMRVICRGDRIQIYLNGTQTVDYREDDDTIERTGVIGLQIHSGPPTEAWYREIRLRRLDP